jgi:plastocyanin domain-containing protein
MAFALLVVSPGCKKEETHAAIPAAPPAKPASPLTVDLSVTEEGFVPQNLTLKQGAPVRLVVTRKTDATCATELLIEGTPINVPLPLNQPVEIAYTPSVKGAVKYGCAMDKMVGGTFTIE